MPEQYDDFSLNQDVQTRQTYPTNSNEGFEEIDFLGGQKNSFSKISVEDSAQSTFDASCLQDSN